MHPPTLDVAAKEPPASESQVAGLAPTEPEILRAPAKEIRLDLACGQTPREGFEGVDIWVSPERAERVEGKGAKHQLNLLRFPWPWADQSVDEIFCSRFVEHIPMCYLTPKGEYVHVPTNSEDKDPFFSFFDECWRILKPGGLFTLILLALSLSRAFQDPTHRRFTPSESFLPIHQPPRPANKLDHCHVKCNFAVLVGDGIPAVDG